MKRGIYDPDHESFHASVHSLLDRAVRPSGDRYLDVKQLPREMWPTFGRHELAGPQIPEQYAGSAAGVVRYNAVLSEELAKVSTSLSSGHGIHADIVARRPERAGGATAARGISGSMDER